MKDSFIFYTSYAEKFKRLSDLQFGQFVRALVFYQLTGEEPEIEDAGVGLAFDVAKIEVDAANEKYLAACEQRREAGQRSAEARAKLKQREQTSVNENERPSTTVNESQRPLTTVEKVERESTTVNESERPSTKANYNDNDNYIYITDYAREEDQQPESDNIKTPSDYFEEFWQVYPNKSARIMAQQAWAELNPDPGTVLQIIAAVKLHREKNPSWARERGRYIPSPANYIRDKRWLDELPEEITQPDTQKPPDKQKAKNQFDNFPQREHSDDYFAELERKKINEREKSE